MEIRKLSKHDLFFDCEYCDKQAEFAVNFGYCPTCGKELFMCRDCLKEFSQGITYQVNKQLKTLEV